MVLTYEFDGVPFEYKAYSNWMLVFKFIEPVEYADWSREKQQGYRYGVMDLCNHFNETTFEEYKGFTDFLKEHFYTEAKKAYEKGRL